MQPKKMLNYCYPNGACLGHYDKKDESCENCKVKEKCKTVNDNDLKDFYPKKNVDVKRFINEKL